MQQSLSRLSSRVYDVIFPKQFTRNLTSANSNFEIDLFDKSLSGNEEQLQAIRNIINRTAHPYPFILFGPPGTGKTVTIVESIKQILKRDKVSIASIFCEQLFHMKECAQFLCVLYLYFI
jgi:DNA replication protein DnaC